MPQPKAWTHASGRPSAGALALVILCPACGGIVAPAADLPAADEVLVDADQVIDLLMRSEWGEPAVPRTGWLQFALINGVGEIDAMFEFLDPLMPFEDCDLRRVENCVVSECFWVAAEYADGGSMDGGANLATVEWLRLSGVDAVQWTASLCCLTESVLVGGLEGRG